MRAAAPYFQHPTIFCVFTILATVFVISINYTVARGVRAFPLICHITTLLSTAMLEPQNRMVKRYAERMDAVMVRCEPQWCGCAHRV
jgi:hypothetical protein